MNIIFLVSICLTSVAISLLILPLSMKLAKRTGAIDIPDERKLHENEIPCLGGLAFTLSLFITCLIFLPFNSIVLAVLSGLIIVMVTGLADDIWHIKPILKFTGEILAAITFILIGSTELINFGNLLGFGTINTGHFAIPVTIFCMVGVMNAVNLIDGLDGLAGGCGVIACLFIAYFSFTSGQWINLFLSLTLLGSLLGFLYYNTYPARVFMGDTGSLALGYCLAVFCVLSQKLEGTAQIAPVSMALIMALPIADTLRVMTMRLIRLKNPFSPDHSHLHYKLLAMNFSHQCTVRIMYSLMTVCGMMAVLFREMHEWLQFLLGILFFVGIYLTVVFLQHFFENTANT